ncbi:hypothetical protein AX774_g3138 [Zancudomyces culisetae]|uniref:Uncharacterized protein n=1 Tax=Zancudomyces culisetae TaxID=1213189 RepID=A0A1R1PCT5_ZANCU|nr:hypothetical protein AX774_g7938 [Zancudomyces culisetae]OMH83353.1 hypothetical protein AX774_g3138 [Zancudomyces culisetae]|eukprot:OMH78662.1 hypothetical protein AX774_g7938 [Zancudomyces culisetae]
MSQKYYDDQYNYNQPPPQHSQGHGYNQGQYPPTMPQAPNYQPQQQYDNTFYPNMGSNPQQNQNQNPNQYLYQQQDYGYPPPPIPTGHALQGQSGSEKFVRTSRFRDLWAAILFLSLFAAHIVFAIIASGGNTKNNLFGLKTGKLGNAQDYAHYGLLVHGMLIHGDWNIFYNNQKLHTRRASFGSGCALCSFMEGIQK